VGVAKAGTGALDGDRSQGVTGTVINTMTPETDSTCFYLWAFARDWCLDKQVITTRLREGVSGVFFEDEVMLEAQQRGIEANPALRLLQPQHRRGQHVDPAHRVPHDRRGVGWRRRLGGRRRGPTERGDLRRERAHRRRDRDGPRRRGGRRGRAAPRQPAAGLMGRGL
jgi:vanillate O-demethylase monooxygenase subunit